MQRDDQRDAGTREQPAQSSRCGRACALRARGELTLSGVEELVLEGVEVVVVARRRHSSAAARRGDRGTARCRRVPVRPSPGPRSVRWRITRKPSRSSSSHPRRRGHSRISASWATSTVSSANGHEPGGSERGQHGLGPRRPRRDRARRARRASPADACPRSLRRARSVAGTRRGRSAARAGRACRRPHRRSGRCAPATPPLAAVAGDRQRPAVASRPHLEQRVRQQRQRPGFAGDVAEDDVGESRLEGEDRRPAPALRSRSQARRSSIGAESSAWRSRRRSELVVARRKCPKKSARSAITTTLRSVGRRRRVDERVEEPPTIVLVLAQREELLELIDDEDDLRSRGRVDSA